jgi:hypothetical protein
MRCVTVVGREPSAIAEHPALMREMQQDMEQP